MDPVREIVISEDGIRLSKRSKKYDYLWQQIRMAESYQRTAYKLYGAGPVGKMVRRTFVLITNDGNKFKFDLSRDFADFSDGDQLEKALKQFLDVKVHEQCLNKKFYEQKNLLSSRPLCSEQVKHRMTETEITAQQ